MFILHPQSTQVTQTSVQFTAQIYVSFVFCGAPKKTVSTSSASHLIEKWYRAWDTAQSWYCLMDEHDAEDPKQSAALERLWSLIISREERKVFCMPESMLL